MLICSTEQETGGKKMSFFDWLFGKGGDQPKEEIVKLESFREIPKWTHAGKKGKTIHCPVCLTPTHVYHFSWSALVCSSCSKKSKKYEWLLVFNSK
jgi:hypothetical protein